MTANGASFDDFWDQYMVGRKGNKPGAERAWDRALKGTKRTPAEKPEVIIASIIQYRIAYAEAEVATPVIPLPATWLNGARWNDPVEVWVSTADRKQKVFEKQKREAAAAAAEAAKAIADAPPEYKRLAAKVATPSENQLMLMAWNALADPERASRIKAVQATFGDKSPKFGVAERIAMGQYWRDQKGTT